jgi:hypothetical protein
MVQHKFSKKNTSGAAAHGVREIALWAAALGAARSGPLAWPRRSALRRGVRGLAPWPLAAAGPLTLWAAALGFPRLCNTEIQPKMS